MPRLVLIYSFASAILFGALFATFYILGFGRPSEAWTTYVAPPPSEVPPPDPLAAGLDHPTLEVGTTYRVSHATKMFPEPAAISLDAELLPARGYFTLESTVDTSQQRWYRVIVSNGANEFSRYILAKDLNFKRVTPVRNEVETDDERRAMVVEALRAQAEARRREIEANRPPPEPEVRMPETWDEWWSMTASRMGGAMQATVAASAVAAGLGTALTIGAILLVISFKREHTWDRAPTHDLDAQWEEATADGDEDPLDVELPDRRW